MIGLMPLQRTFYSLLLLTLAIGLPLLPANCQAQDPPHQSSISKATLKSPLAAVLSTDGGVEMDAQWALAHLLP